MNDLVKIGEFSEGAWSWTLYRCGRDYFCELSKDGQQVAEFWRASETGVDAVLQGFIDPQWPELVH